MLNAVDQRSRAPRTGHGQDRQGEGHPRVDAVVARDELVAKPSEVDGQTEEHYEGDPEDHHEDGAGGGHVSRRR